MTDRAQVTLQVEGMTCEGCARRVESAVKGIRGLGEATVPTDVREGCIQALVLRVLRNGTREREVMIARMERSKIPL